MCERQLERARIGSRPLTSWMAATPCRKSFEQHILTKGILAAQRVVGSKTGSHSGSVREMKPACCISIRFQRSRREMQSDMERNSAKDRLHARCWRDSWCISSCASKRQEDLRAAELGLF